VATGHDNDTDPLADTQTSDHPSSPESRDGVKKRAVHTGDVLGRYELVAEVGEGGMASVYRARDQELRREVAVKVLFPHLARRPEIVRRFQREARAAANLEHRNILCVYDVATHAHHFESLRTTPQTVHDLERRSVAIDVADELPPRSGTACEL